MKLLLASGQQDIFYTFSYVREEDFFFPQDFFPASKITTEPKRKEMNLIPSDKKRFPD